MHAFRNSISRSESVPTWGCGQVVIYRNFCQEKFSQVSPTTVIGENLSR